MNMTPPKLSVIIPCYNHGEFLPEAVASVVSAHRDDVELIVIDDGSTDELTRSQMGALSAQGIHVIRQENRGLAAARNAGIKASRGEYILPLDADNSIRPEYIDRGIQILDAQPRVGVVYGDAQWKGTRTGRWSVGPFNPNRLLHWNYIDACAVYRRDIWIQNGGYDGTMPVQGFEDWDFWIGALEHGWKFHYVPEILFDYRTADNSMTVHMIKFEEEISQFVATKHGPLYRRALFQLANDRESGRATLHNLRRLIKLRIKQKFHRNGQRA